MTGVRKIKGTATTYKHCTLLIKLYPTVIQLIILKPLYIYTGTEQFCKWMVDSVSQVSRCWGGELPINNGRWLDRMIHVVCGKKLEVETLVWTHV